MLACMSCSVMSFDQICTINQTLQHHYCLCPWRSPKEAMCGIACRITATLAPNKGPRAQEHMATSLHQPFPSWQRWSLVGPSRGRGGRAATTMGNHRLLATPATSPQPACNQPATSLEQPKTQPSLCQNVQQWKAPMLPEGDGGSSHVTWWRVALPGAVLGPPTSSITA